MTEKKISYTAVVLEPKSRTTLLANLAGEIPKGWDVIAHHQTINMGEMLQKYERHLGATVTIEATEIAKDDKVIAVKVVGFPTENKIPHITIAVNRNNGGKPFMSNNLTEWTPLSQTIKLKGKVEEVGY